MPKQTGPPQKLSELHTESELHLISLRKALTTGIALRDSCAARRPDRVPPSGASTRDQNNGGRPRSRTPGSPTRSLRFFSRPLDS